MHLKAYEEAQNIAECKQTRERKTRSRGSKLNKLVYTECGINFTNIIFFSCIQNNTKNMQSTTENH